MFRGVINDAKTALGSVVVKYLARASVAVPFVIAVGFATAAITLMLVERFGAIFAYWLVAAGFTAIGVMATFIITVKEQEEEVAEKEAEEGDTAGMASDTAAQVAAQAPLAVLGALMSTPMAPGLLAGGAKTVVRNLPLIVLLALLAMLFWPTATSDAADAAGEEPDLGPKPNGLHTQPVNGLHQDAA